MRVKNTVALPTTTVMRVKRPWAVLITILALCAASPVTAAAAPARALDSYAYDYGGGCLYRTQAGIRALETWVRDTRPLGSSWGSESCRAIPVSAEALEAYEACLREREREEDRARRAEIVCERPRPSWSLHAEGRALDWRLDARVPAEKREASRSGLTPRPRYPGPMSAPLCPSCTQPATTAFAGSGWECRNEACPEFGQAVRSDEPAAPEPAHPGGSLPPDDEPAER